MMLTIHGLPTSTNYQDLKRLIKQECNITDFILDSLVMDDDGCKKVRIGVTDDGDGGHLIKYLNGYRYSGHIVRVVPVGKPSHQNQINFEARGSYPPRNDYQSGSNYGNRPTPHEAPQPRSNWVPNMQWGQGMPPPVQQNTFPNPPVQPVVTNNFPHQQQLRSFAPGGVPQVQQNFGYPPKPNVPDHPGSVMKDNFQGPSQFHHQPPPPPHFQGSSHVQQTSWTPQVPPAKPQSFDKPNPGGYNQMGFNDNRPGAKQGMGADGGYKDYDKGDRRFPPQRGQSPGRRSRMSPGPSVRRMTPPGRRMSPKPSTSVRRASPVRRMSPPRMGGPVPSSRGVSPGRRMTSPRPGGSGRASTPPLGHKLSPQGRRMSPESYRRASPSGPHRDRVSPHGASGRRMSPGRRDTTPRRMSPSRQSPGRRGSPRRMSPKRHSPGRRSVSPRRRSPLLDPPSGIRGYPPSYQSKKSKYDDDDRSSNLKQVRPAYEPSAKAPNQAMYSGGYRPNVHETVQYPASSARSDPWQQITDKSSTYNSSKMMDSRIEKFDRGPEHMRMGDSVQKRSHSGTRDSRSPVRRDRSPFKDRYRRHSPSPRSPRRSWALEKRRSPDVREAPPPPIWPGQNNRESEYQRQNRIQFSDKTEKLSKKPSWERPPYEDNNDRHEKNIGQRPFGQSNPALDKWKPMSQGNPKESLSRDSFRQDERFSESMRDPHSYISKEQFRRSSSVERMPYTDKRDFRDYPIKKDDRDVLLHKKDVEPRRDGFPRGDEREPFRTNTVQLNEEIEDVYKRVAELGKKAQEYRKKESRFEDIRGDEYFGQKEEPMKRARDTRGDYHTDNRFQPRVEETGSRQVMEAAPPVRQRESRWSAPDTSEVWRTKKQLSPSIKAKRDKATMELTRRIMNKFKDHIAEHQKMRVHDEMAITVSRILFDMFKYEDISYIELIIKFNKKYDANDEQKIFEEVMTSFSSNYRKRSAQDQPDVPAKAIKHFPDAIVKDVIKTMDYPKPTAPVRSRNAAWDNARFQTPRVPHDKFKSKHVPEWVRFSNSEPKPAQRANVAQKMTMLNKEINHHGQKMGAKQTFVHPTHKSLLGIKKMAMQKKLSMQSTNIAHKTKMAAHLANVEGKRVTARMKRVPKVLTTIRNTLIQKSKVQEVTAAQRTKALAVTDAQISKAPVVTAAQNTKMKEVIPAQVSKAPVVTAAHTTKVKEVTAAQVFNAQDVPGVQNTRQGNNFAIAKNIVKQESDNTATIKTQNNNPDTSKAHENATAKTISAQELSAQQTKPATGECTTQANDQETEKQGSQESNTAAPSKVKHELNASLARAVEHELQDIMTQMWQELPDNPDEEVNRVVVEKLRNEAGDDLRRVFGLNITKRLLNAYSNLFLKIKFTCRPQMGCLTNFLNEYKIGKFKRIDKNSNTFAAEMDTIEDFDKLCAVKELVCGEAKVTVIPCYKFTHCPENLKTIYDDTYFYEDFVQDHVASIEREAHKAKILASNENINKSAKESQNASNKSVLHKPQTSATNESTETSNKTTKSGPTPDTQKAKNVASNDNIIKPLTKTENKEKNNNPDKLEVKKTEKPMHNDCEDVKKDTANNRKKTINSTKMITTESKLKEKAITDKVPIEKKMSLELGNDEDICEYVIKDILNSDDEDDDDFDAGVPECQMDGDEELDDEDILALMSEGVVLDECSGSEDEK